MNPLPAWRYRTETPQPAQNTPARTADPAAPENRTNTPPSHQTGRRKPPTKLPAAINRPVCKICSRKKFHLSAKNRKRKGSPRPLRVSIMRNLIRVQNDLPRLNSAMK